jgi:hypothetical protein
MNKEQFDALNFKHLQFWQVNLLDGEHKNLAVSFKTESEIKEMTNEASSKLNAKYDYRLQQEQNIDSQTNTFGKSKAQKEKAKAGRPSNKKHWIIEIKLK